MEHQFLQADGSKKTGCFDLTCPGFVQTSNEIALGAAIYPISIPGGLPYQITIYIYNVRYYMWSITIMDFDWISIFSALYCSFLKPLWICLLLVSRFSVSFFVLFFCVIILSSVCLWIDIKIFWNTALNLALTNGLFVLLFELRILSVFNEFPLTRKTVLYCSFFIHYACWNMKHINIVKYDAKWCQHCWNVMLVLTEIFCLYKCLYDLLYFL